MIILVNLLVITKAIRVPKAGVLKNEARKYLFTTVFAESVIYPIH
jgi:hypothetical protein